MKKIILLICVLSTLISNAQINFKSGKSESGIIYSKDGGYNFGYDFSKSEANFIYSRSKEETIVIYSLKNGDEIIIDSPDDSTEIDFSLVVDTTYKSPFSGSNLKVSLPINNGTNSFYNDGKFNTGLGLSYEFIGNKDQFKRETEYKFIRFGYNLQQHKYGTIDSNNTISIDDEWTHVFNITPGINWVTSTKGNSDNFIVYP